MTDVFPVLRVLGMLVMLFALAMGVPLAVSWYSQDGVWQVYPLSMAVTVLAGGALVLGLRNYRRELQPRHGVMLVSLVWVLLPLFATLPLMLACYQVGRPMSFTHAYFEAVSGLTTTGSTVLANLDTLPVSVNVWRTFMQWIGGMGILILAVAVLPMLGVGGSQLFKAEAAGPVKDTKLTPRMTETAKGVWGVYALFSAGCALACSTRSRWRPPRAFPPQTIFPGRFLFLYCCCCFPGSPPARARRAAASRWCAC